MPEELSQADKTLGNEGTTRGVVVTTPLRVRRKEPLTSGSMRRFDERLPVTIAALGLAALALYLPWIGWGVPYATAADRIKTYATDEILPMEGLAEMHSTFVVSKPDRNYGYPWWHYFTVSAAQAPYLAFAKLTGRLQTPTPQYPFGFTDPVESLRWLTLSGRMLSALMAAGSVICAFFFARTLWGYGTGLLAAVLILLHYLVVYYSRTGNPDMPAFFWSSVGVAIFARILVEGFTVRRAAWLGLFAGLAIATKDQTVLVFLPLGASLLLPRIRRSAGLRMYLTGLGVSIAAYLFATGMVVDPQRHITHVTALFTRPGELTFMDFYRPPHPSTWAGTWDVVRDFFRGLVWTSSLPVLVAAAAGVCLAARSDPRRLVLLLPVLALFLTLSLPTRVLVLRYYLPLAIIIDGFAAFALIKLGRRYGRLASAFGIVLVCGFRLGIAADLTYAQAHETRSEAAAWFGAFARPGDRVEYFGVSEKMPPLAAEIRSRRIAGRTNWVRESGHGPGLLKYLAQDGPEFVISIPDFTGKPETFDPSGDCPPEVYRALRAGTAGYTQVAFFPSPSLLPAWFRRPRLDYPTVAPPVRIFARNTLLGRVGAGDRRL